MGGGAQGLVQGIAFAGGRRRSKSPDTPKEFPRLPKTGLTVGFEVIQALLFVILVVILFVTRRVYTEEVLQLLVEMAVCAVASGGLRMHDGVVVLGLSGTG